MTISIITLLLFLQLKHWYIDFVIQTDDEVKGKAIYGNGIGIGHSAKHAFGTLMCILAVTGLPYFIFALLLALIDGIIHYHVDWAKMNYGNRDITTPAFWNHLGLDQMLHQITYIFIAYMIT